MTIIAAVQKKGQMWVAGDRMVSWGDFTRADSHNSSKLVRFRHAIIGSAGRCVYGNALTYLANEDPDKSFFNAPFDTEEQVTAFFYKFYEFVNTKYHLGSASTNDVSGMSGSQFLVVTPRHMFTVSSLRDVVMFDNYATIGSGGEATISAIHALSRVMDDPKAILEHAYATCTHFISNCGGELELIRVNKVLPYERVDRIEKTKATRKKSDHRKVAKTTQKKEDKPAKAAKPLKAVKPVKAVKSVSKTAVKPTKATRPAKAKAPAPVAKTAVKPKKAAGGKKK